jgi:hypothetical protein
MVDRVDGVYKKFKDQAWKFFDEGVWDRKVK